MIPPKEKVPITQKDIDNYKKGSAEADDDNS